MRSPAKPRTRGGRRRMLARGFLALAAVALLLGGWGCFKGLQTLGWPRVPAKIQGSDVRTPETDAQAPAAVYYSYTVGGTEYLSYGIQPDLITMRTDAGRRAQARRYPPGAMVEAATDPADPSVAYLEPGPGDASKIFVAGGVALAGAGFWLRRRAAQPTRANKRA